MEELEEGSQGSRRLLLNTGGGLSLSPVVGCVPQSEFD